MCRLIAGHSSFLFLQLEDIVAQMDFSDRKDWETKPHYPCGVELYQAHSPPFLTASSSFLSPFPSPLPTVSLADHKMTSAVGLHLCTQSFCCLFGFCFVCFFSTLSLLVACTRVGIEETFFHQELEVILPMSFEIRSEN